MGLFTRFRTPSGSNSAPSSSSNGRSTTPAPPSRVHPDLPNPTSSRPSTRQSSYLDSADDGPTPRAKDKEKRGFGWKGKAKADVGGRPYEDQQYPGPAGPSAYAAPVNGQMMSTSTGDRRAKGEKRITAIFHPHPPPEPYPNHPGPRATTPSNFHDLQYPTPASPISPRSDRTAHSGSTERGKARTMSDEFQKDGGALGRLMFEKGPAAKKRDVPSWLVGSAGSGSGEDSEFDLMRDRERASMDLGRGSAQPSNYPTISPSISAPAGFFTDYNRPPPQPAEEPPRQNRFPPVPIRKSSIDPLPRVPRDDMDDRYGQGSAISDGEDEGLVDVTKEAGGAKMGRFWGVKGRRASKAGELDSSAASRSRPPSPTPRKPNALPPVSTRGFPSGPTSPTPRKSSLPPPPPPKSPTTAVSPNIPDQSLPPVSSTARPPNPYPNLRRPSSSFFSNPFARTTSRTSIFTDMESPVVDDGSFQLKGFRHVSGMSQMDAPTAAQGSDPNVSVLGLADLSMASSPTAIDTSDHDDKWDLPPPTRPSITRPSSSASVRTLDSQDSPKVSVAAFKKGIRRPSEGPGVHEGSKSALDDDDDVPLGVLNKGFARAKSSLSLSDQAQSSFDIPKISPALPASPSMGEISRPSSQFTPSPRVAQLSQPPSREPSPRPGVMRTHSPALGPRPMPNGHQRNGGGSGGFVVRSAQSTRSTVSIDSQRGGAWSPGADISRSNSPLVIGDAGTEEVIASPVETERAGDHAIGMDGSYFAPQIEGIPSVPAQQAISPPLPPSSAGMTERNVNLPSGPQSQLNTIMKQPLRNLEPGLHDLVLPPRPSEMNDDPPKPQARPASRQRTSSADFTRRLSSFLIPAAASSPIPDEKEDGFDPALVVQSMKAFSDEPAPISPTINGPSGGRPSLQSRLGQVAGGTGGTGVKPTVARIETDLPPARGNGVKSPASDTTTTPTMGVQPTRPASSFMQTRKVKKGTKSRTVSGKGGMKEGWSSSESDDEDDYSHETHTNKNEKEDVPESSFRKPVGPRTPPHNVIPIASTVSPTVPLNGVKPAAINTQVTSADDSGDDSSSEEETLAVIRNRASKSTLALGTYVSTYGGAPSASASASAFGGQAQPPSSMRGIRSPSSPNLTLSPPASILKLPSGPDSKPPLSASSGWNTGHTGAEAGLRSPPKVSIPANGPGFGPPKKGLSPPTLHSSKNLPSPGSSGSIAPPRRSPLSQSVSSTQLSHEASPPRTAPAPAAAAPAQPTASASPASSQSGLTGDSLLQPVTPRESSVGAKSRVVVQDAGKIAGHGRAESRDSSSQPSNGYGGGQVSSSNSMSSMSPSTEERQRRFSQTSMPVLAPQIAPQAFGGQSQQYQANMDPAAIRNLMKQQWQAQFIAAAYQAAEEEWERASSVGGAGAGMMGGSESGQSAYSAFAAGPAGQGMMGMGMGMPPMPGYGYGYPQMGMGMPGYMPPPGNYGMQGMGGYSPFPPGGQAQGQQGQGMYSYAPGAQSVHGGNFGPAVPQQQAFQQPYQLQYQQYLQQQQHFMQSQQQPYQQYPLTADPTMYGSSPVPQPIQPRPQSQVSSDSAAGPIRQRPRASSRALSSHPLIGIDEHSTNPGASSKRGPPPSAGVKHRASSYNLAGAASGGMRSGMSTSGSMAGLSSSGGNGNGGMSAAQPPPTSWRRSTSEWGGEAANTAPGQRKSRGGFAS